MDSLANPWMKGLEDCLEAGGCRENQCLLTITSQVVLELVRKLLWVSAATYLSMWHKQRFEQITPTPFWKYYD